MKPQILSIALELILPRPSFNRGAASQGNFLKDAGRLEGLLFGLDIEYTLYNPVNWKKKFNLIITKKEVVRLGLNNNAKTKLSKQRSIECASSILKEWGYEFNKIFDGQAEGFLLAVLEKAK
ncbi:MAG: hypothetical protein GF387_00080 [Candidatus Portnoybacteria bacterium]|nr:hypothetical protein [Candidatus Portnoybacteria bacterium]